MVSRGRRRLFLQNRILQQVMLREIVYGLCHLFQIKDLGPSRISGTFSGLELCLDVNQQINLRRICLLDRLLAGRMLLLTGKDGQRTSYTSIRGNNILSLRVGRFTASFRISLSTLRQLRAEGIDTITFQTILCSTTLSVDELLAMGGEDTEVVLTHHIRSSTLTVNGKAV